MRILALEPYYGGSHQAFLAGWQAESRHHWTALTLPARRWKWRLRHAAVTFAEMVADRTAAGESWDCLFCSDMLNLAEFRGLTPGLAGLPAVAYFHENQLTYPVRHADERDYQLAMTNFTTALAAEAVWFNSAFHRDAFIDGLATFLRRMPDYQHLDAVERLRRSACVRYPGIEQPPLRQPRRPGPLRLIWAARWEHDKAPEVFFAALERLQDAGLAFEVSVVGERFKQTPSCFDAAKERFADCLGRWGYLPSRAAYQQALAASDIFVSTAVHEFFGISAVEATAAGCYPVLPDRLAYPEVIVKPTGLRDGLYDGTVAGLTAVLLKLSERLTPSGLHDFDPAMAAAPMGRYCWRQLTPIYDDELQRLAARSS